MKRQPKVAPMKNDSSFPVFDQNPSLLVYRHRKNIYQQRIVFSMFEKKVILRLANILAKNDILLECELRRI